MARSASIVCWAPLTTLAYFMITSLISTLCPLLPYWLRRLSVQLGFISDTLTSSVYFPFGSIGERKRLQTLLPYISSGMKKTLEFAYAHSQE